MDERGYKKKLQVTFILFYSEKQMYRQNTSRPNYIYKVYYHVCYNIVTHSFVFSLFSRH